MSTPSSNTDVFIFYTAPVDGRWNQTRRKPKQNVNICSVPAIHWSKFKDEVSRGAVKVLERSLKLESQKSWTLWWHTQYHATIGDHNIYGIYSHWSSRKIKLTNEMTWSGDLNVIAEWRVEGYIKPVNYDVTQELLQRRKQLFINHLSEQLQRMPFLNSQKRQVSGTKKQPFNGAWSCG